MTNQTVKINWRELVKTTGRGYPEAALIYHEVVEVSSHNDDGTITVITGYNDFGTPMVVRVDPLSEFVVIEELSTAKITLSPASKSHSRTQKSGYEQPEVWDWVHEGSARFTCTHDQVVEYAKDLNIELLHILDKDDDEYYCDANDRNDIIANKLN